MMSVESNESDAIKHLYTPEIEELCRKYWREEENEEELEEKEKEEEEEEVEENDDGQNVYENEGQCFNRLYLALECYDTKTVRRLLMSSVDVNVLEANRRIRPQLYAIVKELLYTCKIPMVYPGNPFDPTSLHIAPENSNSDIRHNLLNSSLDADKGKYSYLTPLPIAPETGCEEIVKALIEYTGGINAVDKNGETALHLAARNDCNALVKILLNLLAERTVRSRLKLAFKALSDKLKLSGQPKRHKVDDDHIPLKSVCTVQAKPLKVYLVAQREHAEIVENLIFNGANVNAYNYAEMTPLHLASKYGHPSIVDILLDNYATVDVNKESWETPFYLAAENGHADVVDVLLRRGISDFMSKFYKKTPLHVAVKGRYSKVVDVILKHSCSIAGKLAKEERRFQENVEDFTEKSGVVPVELMHPDGGQVSAGIAWIERCTPLETRPFTAGSILNLAVKSIQPKMVKTLLSVESVDRRVYSKQRLFKDTFNCMLNTITEMNQRYKRLSEIKSTNIIDIMEVLCYDIKHEMKCKNIKEIACVLMNSKKFNVNHQNRKLDTLLHKVSKRYEKCFYDYHENNSRRRLLQIQTLNDIMQLLLENGADFNMKNASGQTPLIIASENGCSHAIQKLFNWEKKSRLKLDLDARDQYGATALIKAAKSHNVLVMRLLLSHKVSVDLHDYHGFTALHAAVYEPNRDWIDLHLLCKRNLKRIINHPEDFLEIYRGEKTNEKLKLILDCVEETPRLKEEIVKLLLAVNETNVNAIDFKGNTPLDLAVKSSRRLTLETFKALENRGANRNSKEPMDDAPVDVARVDERGRGPLHRLIISRVGSHAVEDMKVGQFKQLLSLYHKRFADMVHGILLKPENFRQSINAVDDKGRTPLHYAVMSSSEYNDDSENKEAFDLSRVLLEIGSNVNAVDRYGKTPLHYAKMNYQYEFLIRHGADESIKDKNGHTPADLWQLQESVIINNNNAKYMFLLPIGKKALYTSVGIERILNANLTDLSKRKLPVAIQIYSRSSRPKESSEEVIWRIWIENDFPSLHKRVSKLKPSVIKFVDRLADGIKEKDGRFECQPILVGSADEETKVVISGDFDFNFKLIKFSQLCDVCPHPLGLNGYFQLRRKSDNDRKRQSDGNFDCFFNLDQCLLTNEVNSRFQIILEDVLEDPNFWQDEHLFEWDFTVTDKYRKPAGLCKTVLLRMIHPIEDGEGGFLYFNVSIDVVACVHVNESCLGDQLPVDINPAGKADGCTLVFDRPRLYLSKPKDTNSIFSDTFSRISFAPLESRIIKESLPVIKAAYTVCKLMLYNYPMATYQLKTSLLLCMEALKIREGCERKEEDRITKKELAFWVERLLFCFMEFCRHDVYPCYFMPSFKLQTLKLVGLCLHFEPDDGDTSMIPFEYSVILDIYLGLCPDDATIYIPLIQGKYMYDLNVGSLIVSQDPTWKQFDREKFIRTLASRRPSF